MTESNLKIVMNFKIHNQLKKYIIGSINKSTIWAFLGVLLFKITLDLSYYFIISPIFEYMRFSLNLNVIKLIESYFLFTVIFILMPKSSKKLSTIIVWLLILLSYIPILTIFAFKDESRIFTYAVTLFWISIFLLLHAPRINFPSLKESKIIRLFLLISLSTLVFFTIYKYLGLSFKFDLTKVYDIRTQYVQTKIPLAGYFFNWMGYVVNVAFFALFINKKKWIFAALIAVLQLLLFSATGNKTFLFALPFALALMWIISRKNPLTYMAVCLIAIILLGMLSYWLVDDVWIISLFTRRVLFVPAQLTFYYYDFFSAHEPVFLSHSIFRFFLNYPYPLGPPHLIGEVYFDKPQMAANNGIIGDAFMNFRFIGLVFWSTLLVIILKLVDSCSKGKNIKIGTAVVALPVIALTNSALLTCLLTHGLLLALLLLYLLPKEQPLKQTLHHG